MLSQLNQENFTPNQPLLNYIKSLRKHVHVALLSNLDKTSIRTVRNEVQLQDYFEKIYFSAEERTGKLEKNVVEKVLRDFNVTPDETLFIDDFPGNIDKAKKYGMHTLLCTTIADVKKHVEKLLNND